MWYKGITPGLGPGNFSSILNTLTMFNDNEKTALFWMIVFIGSAMFLFEFIKVYKYMAVW